MKKNVLYVVLLLILMPLGLLIQNQFNPEYASFLKTSYGINFFLAFFSLFLLGWGIHYKKENLVILYLITVVIKGGVYFLYFYPRFEMDGLLMRSEFFIFFIPYSIGLFLEIVVLARRYQ